MYFFFWSSFQCHQENNYELLNLYFSTEECLKMNFNVKKTTLYMCLIKKSFIFIKGINCLKLNYGVNTPFNLLRIVVLNKR